ncbi:MAG: antitoxin Xre/MbcA/ParS toxin-binding domain-containing protein [Pseudomonadota bacterium]
MAGMLAVAASDTGRVLTQALIETADRLGIGPSELKAIIGVSQPTASRLLHGAYELVPGSKSFELAAHLVRLYRSLAAMVGGDDALAARWLRSANRAFDDARPIDAIKRVDGLLYACEYLDAHRARV